MSTFCDRAPKLYLCGANAIGLVSFPLATTGIGVCILFYLFLVLRSSRPGNVSMNSISNRIASAALSFLVTEYSYIAVFVSITSLVLGLIYTFNPSSAEETFGARYTCSFVGGVLFAAIVAGVGGVWVPTYASIRTTQAADKGGLVEAMRVALKGSALMGFSVITLGLFGVSLAFYLLHLSFINFEEDHPNDRLAYSSHMLASFGFGISFVALFVRVAGGIFSKAADVGAYLVGNLDMNIAEDDPSNPVVIADNVGDIVGKAAGMIVDMLDSFVASIIASVSLAGGDRALIALPFWIAGGGIISSVLGMLAVSPRNPTKKDLILALYKGKFVSCFFSISFSALIISQILDHSSNEGWRIYVCVCIGIFAGLIIAYFTVYATTVSYRPVKSITGGYIGQATVIIRGLGIGLVSCVFPVLVVVATILSCYTFHGAYGLSMAAVGMLSTSGIAITTDGYEPIADNAVGIARLAALNQRVYNTTASLGDLGIISGAAGKGFAMGSAALTSLSLLAAFRERSGVGVVDLGDPVVLSGILLGAMLPSFFASLTLLSVQKAAGAMVTEFRGHFAKFPVLGQCTSDDDSERCLEIFTQRSVEEMILPGLYAILFPITVGFLIGPKCLISFLGSSIASSMMLSITMANSGGALESAKKTIGSQAENLKGSKIYNVYMMADAVGDPLKDTSAPSLLVLMKIMPTISLTLAPLMSQNPEDWHAFYYGCIPGGLLCVATVLAYCRFLNEDLDTYGDFGESCYNTHAEASTKSCKEKGTDKAVGFVIHSRGTFLKGSMPDEKGVFVVDIGDKILDRNEQLGNKIINDPKAKAGKATRSDEYDSISQRYRPESQKEGFFAEDDENSRYSNRAENPEDSNIAADLWLRKLFEMHDSKKLKHEIETKIVTPTAPVPSRPRPTMLPAGSLTTHRDEKTNHEDGKKVSAFLLSHGRSIAPPGHTFPVPDMDHSNKQYVAPFPDPFPAPTPMTASHSKSFSAPAREQSEQKNINIAPFPAPSPLVAPLSTLDNEPPEHKSSPPSQLLQRQGNEQSKKTDSFQTPSPSPLQVHSKAPSAAGGNSCMIQTDNVPAPSPSRTGWKALPTVPIQIQDNECPSSAPLAGSINSPVNH